MTKREDIIEQTIVEALIQQTSDQLQDIPVMFADGAVRVYSGVKTRAMRTEMDFEGGVVVLHKNADTGAGDMFAAASRFNRVEIKRKVGGETVKTIEIGVDRSTSPTNPLYHFIENAGFEDERIIGVGYGQRMDLQLARLLIGADGLPPTTDQIPFEMVELIKNTLAAK